MFTTQNTIRQYWKIAFVYVCLFHTYATAKTVNWGNASYCIKTRHSLFSVWVNRIVFLLFGEKGYTLKQGKSYEIYVNFSLSCCSSKLSNLNPVVFPRTKNKDQQGYAQPGPCKLLEEKQGNNEWVKMFPAHMDTHIYAHINAHIRKIETIAP